MNVIEGLSNEFYWRLVQHIYISGLFNRFFLLEVCPMGFKRKNILF